MLWSCIPEEIYLPMYVEFRIDCKRKTICEKIF